MTSDLKYRAIDWFVRLRAPDATSEDRDRHADWLAEDASHRAAQAAVEEEWRNLDGLSDWAKTELQRLEVTQLPRKRIRLRYWLLGFSMASAAALALFLLLPALAPSITQEHFATASGEQRRVMLEDGSRMHLNSSTAVDIRFSVAEREVRLIEGEGLFDVAHDPDRPFVVEFSGGRVVAVGTRFSVYFVANKLAVTVLEGKVVVIPETKRPPERPEPELLLEPNQQAHIDLTRAIKEVKTVDATRLTAWDKGLLVFDNTPLTEVAAEISRYVGGEIRLAAGVPDYAVTGTIKIRDMETMLRILSEVAPVTPVRTSPAVTTLMYSPRPLRQDDHS